MQKKTKKTKLEEIFKTRRSSLRLVSRSFSSYLNMSLQLGISEALLTQIIGDNSTRTIDEPLARTLEKKLSIPAGSLDSPKLFE